MSQGASDERKNEMTMEELLKERFADSDSYPEVDPERVKRLLENVAGDRVNHQVVLDFQPMETSMRSGKGEADDLEIQPISESPPTPTLRPLDQLKPGRKQNKKSHNKRGNNKRAPSHRKRDTAEEDLRKKEKATEDPEEDCGKSSKHLHRII